MCRHSNPSRSTKCDSSRAKWGVVPCPSLESGPINGARMPNSVHIPRLAYFDVKGCVIYALADGARSMKLQERNRLYIQCSSLDRLVLKGRGCFDNLHTQKLHSDLVALFYYFPPPSVEPRIQSRNVSEQFHPSHAEGRRSGV